MEKITPTIEQLTPNKEIKCNFENCTSIFTNYGNYRMHMLRHHKKVPEPSITNRQKLCCYYCPITDCDYHQNSNIGKCFSEMKYIRQHFQKVHTQKSLFCPNECGKTFITARQLEQHLKKVCGRVFNCKLCCWTYNTTEALHLHLKRKHANEMATIENANKVPLERFKPKRLMQKKQNNNEKDKQNRTMKLPTLSSDVSATKTTTIAPTKTTTTTATSMETTAGMNLISNNLTGQALSTYGNIDQNITTALIDFTCKVNDEQPLFVVSQRQMQTQTQTQTHETIKDTIKIECQTHDEYLKELGLANYILPVDESDKTNNNNNSTNGVHLKLNCLFVNQMSNINATEKPKKIAAALDLLVENAATQIDDTASINLAKQKSNPVSIETQTTADLIDEVEKIVYEWNAASKNIETQTEKSSNGLLLNNLLDENSINNLISVKTYQNSLTQTENASQLPKLNTNPVNIETQTCDDLLTEVSKLACGWNAQKNMQTQTDKHKMGFLNNFLVENSVNIQTQTHGDYFTELGLADIQTQTNWTSYENLAEKNDEFFVQSPNKVADNVPKSVFVYGATMEVDEIVTKNANSKNRMPVNKEMNFQQTQTTDLFEIFGQSTHCYTQTNDNFLENFNLTELQNVDNTCRKNKFVSTATSCFPEELFVSTETQTSFTQCFFDSRTSMGDVHVSPDVFNTDTTTQYTQTCNLEQLD